MLGQGDDILTEIPDDQLPKLAALYEKNAAVAPYMISLVHMGMRWKRSAKFSKAITFTSPTDTWEKDGTIIAVMTCHCYDIFIFTLDDNQIPNIYQGLSKTKFLDYKKNVQFFGFHEKFYNIIAQIIEEKKLKITHQRLEVYFMGLPPEKARNLEVKCPPDVYIDKLEVSAASQISAVYPYPFPGIVDYMSDFIEINGGYGVYLKSTNELVAWVLRHAFGHVGILQTEEKHTRKGYASLLVSVLSKQLGEEGFWSSATVKIHYSPSRGTFEKLGFQVINNAMFINVE